MEDDNLLDEELTGPSRDFDSPATFNKNLILKFGIRHASTEADTVNNNNNIVCGGVAGVFGECSSSRLISLPDL